MSHTIESKAKLIARVRRIKEHIRHHVVNPDTDPDARRAKGAAELIEVVRTYLK
jgi:DNA-binding FrmR family transcriptional regulator